MPFQCCHALLPFGLAQIPHSHGIVRRAGSRRPSSNAVTDHTGSMPFSVARIAAQVACSDPTPSRCCQQSRKPAPIGQCRDRNTRGYAFPVATHCCSSRLFRSHLHGVVKRAGSQPPIGQCRDRSHPWLCLQCCHALLPIGLTQIPHLHGIVTRAGSQPLHRSMP